MSAASERGRRNRAHGHESERMVVRWLREHSYPDAETTRRRLGADGAKQPGDVAFTPGVSLDVKSRKQSSWPSWQRQALKEAGPNRIAAVVRRTRGNPNVADWECRWGHPCDDSWSPCDEGICVQAVCGRWTHGTFAEFISSLEDEVSSPDGSRVAPGVASEASHLGESLVVEDLGDGTQRSPGLPTGGGQ